MKVIDDDSNEVVYLVTKKVAHEIYSDTTLLNRVKCELVDTSLDLIQRQENGEFSGTLNHYNMQRFKFHYRKVTSENDLIILAQMVFGSECNMVMKNITEADSRVFDVRIVNDARFEQQCRVFDQYGFKYFADQNVAIAWEIGNSLDFDYDAYLKGYKGMVEPVTKP